MKLSGSTLVLGLGVAALAGCSDDVVVVATPHPSSVVEEVTVTEDVAAMIGGTQKTIPTLLDPELEPGAPTFFVYLPSDEPNAGPYPVLYLLHGFGGDQTYYAFFHGIQSLLDDLIQAGTIEPMIVVMPNGMSDMIGSFYTNSVFDEAVGLAAPENVAFGAFQTYLLGVMQQVEASFNVDVDPLTLDRLAAGDLPAPTNRAIAGLSMGAYGATVMAEKVPVFTAVASHSGPLNFANMLEVDPLLGASVPQILLAETQAALGMPLLNAGSASLIGSEAAPFTTFAFAMSAAFTPYAGPPLAFDMLADLDGDPTNNFQYPIAQIAGEDTPETMDDDLWIGVMLPADASGRTVDFVFDQWLADHDAFTLLGDPAVAGALGAFDTDFFIDVGTVDELGLADDVTEFAELAQQVLPAGQVEFQTFAGDHSSLIRSRLEVSIPWISAIFGEE
jgi:S-formylglutathione hydrolase FrmB